MNLPSNLKPYKISEDMVPVLAKASRGNSMSGNPVYLSDDDIAELLARLI